MRSERSSPAIRAFSSEFSFRSASFSGSAGAARRPGGRRLMPSSIASSPRRCHACHVLRDTPSACAASFEVLLPAVTSSSVWERSSVSASHARLVLRMSTSPGRNARATRHSVARREPGRKHVQHAREQLGR